MVDRLVPYPSEALAYAAGYGRRQQLQADADYIDIGLRIAQRR